MRRQGLGIGETVAGEIGAECDAPGAANRRRLFHQADQHLPAIRIGNNRADAVAGDAGGAAEADQKYEFLPLRQFDVGRDFGFDASTLAGRQEGGKAGAFTAIRFAELQAGEIAIVADRAGLADKGRNMGNAADHRSCAEDGRQTRYAVNTILERDKDCVRADQRLARFRRRLAIP